MNRVVRLAAATRSFRCRPGFCSTPDNLGDRLVAAVERSTVKRWSS
jgi:hypothetical protein